MTKPAAAKQPPVSAIVVGKAFVQQYYHILHLSPGLIHRLYQDISKLGRVEEDGTMSITTTMDAINVKILSLKYDDFTAKIKSVDAQDSLDGGVQILVTGYLTGKDNFLRNFTQSFFLAPQDKGYFILNDIFRYMEVQSIPEQGPLNYRSPTATPAAAKQQQVSAQVVGHAFVEQYYHVLHQLPELVHRFFKDISKLDRQEEDGTMSTTTTMDAIKDKILSLNYDDFSTEIKSVDAQESLDGGVQVLVTGYLTGKDNFLKNFTQSFFLAPQDNGYFVLNDICRYMESATIPQGLSQFVAKDVTVPSIPEQGDIYLQPPVVIESKVKLVDEPKKTFASTVMSLNQNDVPSSSPVSVTQKSQPKSVDCQANFAPQTASVVNTAASGSEVVDTVKNQEEEATESVPVQVNHVSEQEPVLVKEADWEEVVYPSEEDGEEHVVAEEVQVASPVIIESKVKPETAPKKTFAPIGRWFGNVRW